MDKWMNKWMEGRDGGYNQIFLDSLNSMSQNSKKKSLFRLLLWLFYTVMHTHCMFAWGPLILYWSSIIRVLIY